MDINNYPGLNDDSTIILDRLLSSRNTDEVLEYIDEQKYKLSKNKQSSQQPYVLLLVVEQAFIAKPVVRLAIPYHVDHLRAFRPTLNALFQMKCFLIDQTRIINEAMFELDVVNTLPSLNFPSLFTASAPTTHASYIFWKTKQHFRYLAKPTSNT